MKKYFEKQVKIDGIVNWHKVKKMEANGHVFKNWSDYPKVTPDRIVTVRFPIKTLHIGPVNKRK